MSELIAPPRHGANYRLTGDNGWVVSATIEQQVEIAAMLGPYLAELDAAME